MTTKMMRYNVMGAALGMLVIAACHTAQPGVSNTLGRYDMVVDAPPARVTQAAVDVLEGDYKFKIESSSYSTVDGKVTAHTGVGTAVYVWVQRQTDNEQHSALSIRIGELTGNEQLSLEILGKIKVKANSLMEKIKEKI